MLLCIVKKGNFKMATAESEKLKQSRKKNLKQIIMKKLLIIAVASCFTFTSCSKVEPTPAPQSSTVSQSNSKLGIVQGPQRYTITNTETNWGIVEYRLTYTDQNNAVQTIVLNMGQSVSLCLGSNVITTNFAYTIVVLGNC